MQKLSSPRFSLPYILNSSSQRYGRAALCSVALAGLPGWSAFKAEPPDHDPWD